MSDMIVKIFTWLFFLIIKYQLKLPKICNEKKPIKLQLTIKKALALVKHKTIAGKLNWQCRLLLK